MRTLALRIIAPFVLLPDDSQAGGSLFVDDAAIVPDGRFQLEMWTRFHAPELELTAVPAYNFFDIELGVGISQFFRPRRGPIANLGLKRLFHDFGHNPWGIGASLGATWNSESDRFDGWSLNVPASVSLDSKRRAVLHSNLGWSDLHYASAAATAALGFELKLVDSWLLLGETSGDHRTFASHLGVRRDLDRDASLDVLLGHQDDLDNAWLTVGLNIILPE